jgi:hypothetical protein
VETFFPCRVIMPRLHFYLRLVAVAIASPFIAIYIVVVASAHFVSAAQRGSRRNREVLRLWMSVSDWVKGIPVGYSYWEQYQAPVMLDEIVVHHDE